MDANGERIIKLLAERGTPVEWSYVLSELGMTSTQLSVVIRSLAHDGIIRLLDGTNRPRMVLTAGAITPKDRGGSAARSPAGRNADVAVKGSILIFVPLAEELAILRKSWPMSQKFVHEPWVAEVAEGLRVSVLPAYGAGRVRAAVEVLHYLESLEELPDLVFVLGMCGGFQIAGSPTPVNVGDVIVADRVVDLGTRAMRSGSDGSVPEFRIEPYPTDSRVAFAVRADAFDLKGWQAQMSDSLNYTGGQYPQIHIGTLVCVDEVVSSDEWRNELVSAWPKSLGIEMEAGGVIAACSRLGVGVAVVRGVSDLANPLKADDEWRRRSVLAAASVVVRAVEILT